MIGLILIPAFVIWLLISAIFSSKLPTWLGVKKQATAWTFLLFPLVLIAPVADEIIGQVQFHYLCKREAVIWLSPDWNQVKVALDGNSPITEVHGYVVPIEVQRVEFLNAETHQPFLSYKGFHTKGGFLMRHGLGFNGTTSCWPKNKTDVLNKVNIDQLLKLGR